MKYSSPFTLYSSLCLFLLLICGGAIPAHALNTKIAPETSTPDLSPWMKPRSLSSFQSLMQHSPFSLATAEESSPLSERYTLTGIVTIDGEDQVFVFDKNDQSHELLTKKPNTKGMALIGLVPSTDPNKLKASIRANGEIGVITSAELPTNNPTTGPHRFVGPGAPSSMPGGANQPRNMMHPPTMPHYPGPNQPPSQNSMVMPPNTTIPSNMNMPPNANMPSNPNNRRVIRRPAISGQTPSMDASQP